MTSTLDDQALVTHMIRERHPGKAIVTASLKTRSIVVLKMVANVGPSTAVLFCQPGRGFEESKVYRGVTVAQFEPTNVRLASGREVEVKAGATTEVFLSFAGMP